MSRATGKATPNTGQTTSATITAVMSTPGRTRTEADGGTGDHAQGDAGSAVEQYEGHPDVEEELGPDPVEGDGDDPEHRRPDQGSRRDEHDHLGNLYERR